MRPNDRYEYSIDRGCSVNHKTTYGGVKCQSPSWFAISCDMALCRMTGRVLSAAPQSTSSSMSTLWNYKEALTWLEERIPHGTLATYPGQQGVDRTTRLLAALGHPEERLRIIHVAGTSGKGSTAYLTGLLLVAQGHRTGLALSPYLIDVRERCLVDNALPAKATVAATLAAVKSAVEQLEASGDCPTYFEVVTVLALLLFARERCRYAVLETGLGGTFDATNAIQSASKVGVITRIGLDHTARGQREE